jgi:hypothetical protein
VTSWNQSEARPHTLPPQKSTEKHKDKGSIQTLSGIRTHDTSILAATTNVLDLAATVIGGDNDGDDDDDDNNNNNNE